MPKEANKYSETAKPLKMHLQTQTTELLIDNNMSANIRNWRWNL